MPLLRRSLFAALVAGLSFAAIGAARAAELVVLERVGCPWCARFEAEAGKIWEKTEEGRRVPLRRLDIDAPLPEGYGFLLPERITPTFVLVADGREVARLRGYPGQDFFWAHIATMLAQLPN